MSRLFIRVDANSKTGSGHLLRCLRLADALKSRFEGVVLFTRDRSPQFSKWIEAFGFDEVLLSKAPSGQGTYPHSEWLQCEEIDDAKECVEIALTQYGASGGDTFLVDHYALGAPWEEHCRKITKTVIAIDDLADRPHACDVLIDQNYYSDQEQRYVDLVPPATRALLGPQFAILSEDLISMGRTVRTALPRLALDKRGSEKLRLLLFFGGVDSMNATGAVLEHLIANDLLLFFDTRALIGEANPHRSLIRDLALKHEVQVLDAPIDFPKALSETDLFIGAGGTTTWERLYLGVPSVVVTIADNQVSTAQDLAADGYQIYAGSFEGKMWKRGLSAGVRRYLEDSSWVKESVEKSRKLVDGNGTSRIVSSLPL
jgi:UDP-2,4-diacetamido-2,4,6-trideoxy-beta-L-altropyranose hydrolase